MSKLWKTWSILFCLRDYQLYLVFKVTVRFFSIVLVNTARFYVETFLWILLFKVTVRFLIIALVNTARFYVKNIVTSSTDFFRKTWSIMDRILFCLKDRK